MKVGVTMRIKPTQILPLTMMLLSIGAALVYLAGKDYRHAAYWFSSAAIIASVTL